MNICTLIGWNDEDIRRIVRTWLLQGFLTPCSHSSISLQCSDYTEITVALYLHRHSPRLLFFCTASGLYQVNFNLFFKTWSMSNLGRQSLILLIRLREVSYLCMAGAPRICNIAASRLLANIHLKITY